MDLKLRPARSASASSLKRRRAAAEFIAPDPLEARMRISSAPQDKAHYGCECGYHFTARVATSVSCPRCGTGQAW